MRFIPPVFNPNNQPKKENNQWNFSQTPGLSRCGQKTNFTGTKECNRCWELRHRIETDVELAEKILNHFKSEELK